MDLGLHSVMKKLTVEFPAELEMDQDTSHAKKGGVSMSGGIRVPVDEKANGL